MKDACGELELLLTEFAADELEAADAERVAGHVAVCAACRAELEREVALRGALGRLPVQPGPAVPFPGFRARRGGWRRRWAAAGGLAAAVLAAALFLRPGDGGSPAPDAGVDVAAVRRDARTSLALAARIMERSERHTVVDVFGRQLPAAIRGALPDEAVTPEGGQG